MTEADTAGFIIGTHGLSRNSRLVVIIGTKTIKPRQRHPGAAHSLGQEIPGPVV